MVGAEQRRSAAAAASAALATPNHDGVRTRGATRYEERPVVDAVIEEVFVRTFFRRELRDRFVTLLATPRRRRDALNELYHGCPVDARYLHKVSGTLESALRARGAPPECYAISADADLDGRRLPLADALAVHPEATILVCVPDALGCLLMEDIAGQFLVARGAR